MTDYQPIDVVLELGVPLGQRGGQPNLRDHVPKRFVPLAEAQARGWTSYWDGGACRYGHQASRQVTNVHLCSDCVRVKKGQTPIYPRSKAQEFNVIPAKDPAPGLLPAAPVVPEPSPADKRLLASYATERDLDKAAAAVGSTPALVTGRRSHDTRLDAAMSKLETDLTIPKHVPAPVDFEWTDEKRARLIEAYVDAGNLEVGRAAIKCTPSQLWRHLDANSTFAEKLEDARPRAMQVFEERAHALAAAGNDKIIPLILKAERPDKYRDTLKLELSGNNKLTDVQLDARLLQMLAKLDRLDPARMQRLRAEAAIDVEVIALPAPAQVQEPEASGEVVILDNGEDLR
jgi:hypothetical protein